MKAHNVVTALAVCALALARPAGMQAQHANPGGAAHDMSQMAQAPHHILMMTYMKSMTLFATSLRDQALKQEPLDAEFARGAVAELRHDFDAAEGIHNKHMQSMSGEKKAEMEKMMKEMPDHHAMLEGALMSLENDVKADGLNAAKMGADASALLDHLSMMSKM